MNNRDRKAIISVYKNHWFQSLMMGYPVIDLEEHKNELIEDEKYEECEGINLAIVEYEELLRELDEE